MRFSYRRNTIAMLLALCAVIIFLVWSFLQGRREMVIEQEGDQPINAPSRVVISPGNTVIHLDETAQKINGIITKAIAPAFFVGQKPVPGQVPRRGAKRIPGVIVPDSAVVWLQGKTWTYVQEGSDRFVRRELSPQQRTGEGWLVTKDFSVGDRVVVEGAQLLLSEEFRSEIRISDQP